MAQIIGLVAWGIENAPTRTYVGANLLIKAVTDKDKIGPLINKRVALVPADLFSFNILVQLQLCTFLTRQCQRIYSSTINVKFVVTFKPSKRSSLKATMAENNFNLIKGFQVTKAGSLEKKYVLHLRIQG